jgi:hypothetical protein
VLRLALLLLLLFLAVPASASAAPDQVMTFEAPRELLDGATRDRTLDEIAAFGVKRVRVLVYWSSIAPRSTSRQRPSFDAAEPAAYPASSWERYDGLVEAARARGISVYMTLTGPAPRWATKARRDTLTDPRPDEFGDFATAVGRRYGAQVDIWSIWNEPNQPQFLLPQYRNGRPASPALYRRLYRAAHQGLERSGNGRDTILLGETSPRGNQRVVAPLAFLRGTLCLSAAYRQRRGCGKLATDGYAHHPYTTRVGPSFRPPNRDDVTIGVLSRLTQALDRAARAGAVDRGLNIYLTEFGIQSSPDPSAVSLARQAEYLGISEHLAFLNRRVKAFSQYLMSDDPPGEGDERYGGFESGLRRFDGRAKPAYAAFRTPLRVTDYGRSDVGWGLVRPASGPTAVVIEYRNRGARRYRTLQTVTTNAAGVFAFKSASPAGRRYRVRWAAPTGEVFVGPPVRSYG